MKLQSLIGSYCYYLNLNEKNSFFLFSRLRNHGLSFDLKDYPQELRMYFNYDIFHINICK